ncbi:hypothetical protein B0H14DRAFT_3782470 [Mycena olivaceomarginata]|nr:hypothetical protein B0H14DRAFT_3782470 [Mycena olivaceomarginata]
MTTRQAQHTAALNLSGTQPTTVTYNDPAAVETLLNVEGGTPAAALAPEDTVSVQGSLPDLQTVSDSSTSNVTSSVNVEGINPRVIIAKAGAARVMLISSIKRATDSHTGDSLPAGVEVETLDMPPSAHTEQSMLPQNEADSAPVSAVRIQGLFPADGESDVEMPPDSAVGTEPGTTPTPAQFHGRDTNKAPPLSQGPTVTEENRPQASRIYIVNRDNPPEPNTA